MKNRWLILFLISTSAHTIAFSNTKQNALEENLTLRRITEYWKEGDFSTVRVQIKSFLKTYPKSAYADSLTAMLGDLLFNEKNYAEAQIAYNQITDPLFQKQIHYNHLYCLYQQGLFHDVINLATSFLENGYGSKEQANTVRFQMADSLFKLGQITDHPDAKQDLYTQAIAHFKVLNQTSYADRSMYPLAIIYTHLNNHDKAAQAYEALASQHPHQKEEFLFHAATLYLNVNKNKAIELYGKIHPLNGKYAAHAAFNQIQLLFEQKRYKDLLIVQETTFKYIPVNHINLIRYYIGKSLFAIGDYKNAALHFTYFVEGKFQQKELLKNACFSLVQCAQKTQDMLLFDTALEHLVQIFPKDLSTAQALILHANISKKNGDLQRAQSDLQILIHSFPYHTDQDLFCYDYALVLCQSQQWAQSTQALKEWLSRFSKSPLKTKAYRHLLLSQSEEIKNASQNTLLIKKQELITTLEIALQEKNIFSQTDTKQLHYLLGKTLYEIGAYPDALAKLTMYVSNYPKDPSCAQAYLLMTDCHIKGDFNAQAFITDAQHALTLNPNLPQNPDIHLQLYNAYFLLTQKSDAQIEENMNLAADHLFSALTLPLKKENLLWLAHHYTHRFQNTTSIEQDLYLQRAISVLEKLLLSPIAIEDPLEIEAEAIKLSQLYQEANTPSRRIDLLNQLQTTYAQYPDAPWKYKRLSLFELAQAYEQINDADNAIATYNQLIGSSIHTYSYFGIASRLQKTRLQFDQLLPDQKLEQSNFLQSIYDELKNLQIQKKLVSEPWHLEAALTYIDIKVMLTPQEQQTELHLQLISQAYDRFSSLEDPLVQQYLAPADQFPEKILIHQHYMQFLLSEKLRLEGSLAIKIGDIDTAHIYHKKAQTQYTTLLQQQLHPLLEKRMRSHIEELKIL